MDVNLSNGSHMLVGMTVPLTITALTDKRAEIKTWLELRPPA